MTPETAVTLPVQTITIESTVPAEHLEALTVVHSPPTSEQIQATQTFFSESTESNEVLGLLGVWTSVALLRDLAFDAVASSEEEMQRQLGKGIPRRNPC